MRAFNRLALSFTAFGSIIAAAGCSAEPEHAEQASDATLGSFPVSSAKLDAIGTIRIGAATRTRTCTGTLIAQGVVLTAEHCVLGVTPEQLRFVVGASSASPKRSAAVRAIAFENTTSGGVLQRGSDVAVLQLLEPITDVRPLLYEPFDASAVGKSYLAVGYGGRPAARKASAVTLRSVSGPIFPALFGSFQTFLRYAPRFLDLDQSAASLRATYDAKTLLEGYEATFRTASATSGSCNAGGPLLRWNGTRHVVQGIVSWGYEAASRTCAFGGVDAVLGPSSIDFIDQQLGCPFVPAGGTCRDAALVSCTESAGVWTARRVDCGARSQSCVVGWDGTAGCADACAGAPPRCEDDVLVTCREESGTRDDERFDCADAGQTCMTDDAGNARCADPCEGVPREGVCLGNVAFRCTYPNEGPRRLVAADCGILEQACGIDVITSEVGCIDPPL
ncbi:MAG TPA: trypsin-like serine protease [Polyangiaceae bacterium]